MPQQILLLTLSYTRASRQPFTTLKSFSVFSVWCTITSQHALLNQPALTDSLAFSYAPQTWGGGGEARMHTFCTHLYTQCVLTGQKTTLSVCSQAPYTFCLRQDLSLVWNCVWYTGTLAGLQTSWDPPVLPPSLILGSQACTFDLVSREPNLVPLVYARQVLYQLSHLSSLCPLQLGSCLPGKMEHDHAVLTVC